MIEVVLVYQLDLVSGFARVRVCDNHKIVQWDQSSPGNSASHYSDQSMIKLNFSAA